MRITWENIVHHAGTIYKHDISNKIQDKTKVWRWKVETQTARGTTKTTEYKAKWGKGSKESHADSGSGIWE